MPSRPHQHINPDLIQPSRFIPGPEGMIAVANAAINENAVCYILDAPSSGFMQAAPCNPRDPSTLKGKLYVALNAAAAAGTVHLVPRIVLAEEDTSSYSAGDPLYLAADGAYSSSSVGVGVLIGRVMSVDASVGHIEVNPELYRNSAYDGGMWMGAPSPTDPDFMSKVHVFEDDFNGTLHTDWVVTEDSAGATQATIDSAGGEVVLTNAATSDNDACQIVWAGEQFKLALTKHLWFEAIIQCDAGDATNLDFYVGLLEAEDLTGVADNMPANGVGFHKDDGDTNIDLSSSDGGTNTQEAAVGTLVDATKIKLGFRFDPGLLSGGTVTPYINGVAGTAISVTYATMAEMAAGLMIRNGDATTTQVLKADYVKVWQLR